MSRETEKKNPRDENPRRQCGANDDRLDPQNELPTAQQLHPMGKLVAVWCNLSPTPKRTVRKLSVSVSAAFFRTEKSKKCPYFGHYFGHPFFRIFKILSFFSEILFRLGLGVCCFTVIYVSVLVSVFPDRLHTQKRVSEKLSENVSETDVSATDYTHTIGTLTRFTYFSTTPTIKALLLVTITRTRTYFSTIYHQLSFEF